MLPLATPPLPPIFSAKQRSDLSSPTTPTQPALPPIFSAWRWRSFLLRRRGVLRLLRNTLQFSRRGGGEALLLRRPHSRIFLHRIRLDLPRHFLTMHLLRRQLSRSLRFPGESVARSLFSGDVGRGCSAFTGEAGEGSLFSGDLPTPINHGVSGHLRRWGLVDGENARFSEGSDGLKWRFGPGREITKICRR